MSKMTVRHDCGHKSVIDVGDGPAHDKAARVFEATLQNCPACREHEESDEGFAISQNTRIEQEEAGVISLPTKRQQQRQPRQPRQSREAQRNARIHQAYLTLREVACRNGHANHRCFSVASTSDPTVHYTLTWDTETDRVQCDCMAGQHARDCVHQAAMRAYIHGVHESERRAHDPAERAKRAEETRRIETAMLARDNRPFSLLAR